MAIARCYRNGRLIPSVAFYAVWVLEVGTVMEYGAKILAASEEVVIDGRTVRLAAILGRDLMPVDPDTRIGASLRVIESSSGAVVDGIASDRAWFVRGTEAWQSPVRARITPEGSLEFVTTDGPRWDDPRVGVVLEIVESDGTKHHLAAKAREVFASC